MPYNNYGDYFHFISMTDKTESHHIGFILNHRYDIYITSSLNILEEKMYHLQNYLKKLEPWMNANIQISAQLSKTYVWNQDSQQMEQIYNEREYQTNILSYVHLARI